MTREGAVSTGQNAATRFGKVFIVYRMPGWPPDVFGCRAEDKGLPPGTETFERLAPGGSAAVPPANKTGQAGLFFEDAGVPADHVPTFDGQPLDARAHAGDGDGACEELEDEPVDWTI